MKFPAHKCGLYLEHNVHKDVYDSAKQWMEESGDNYAWADDESRERAVLTDEIWTLQWYPDTPVGFYAVAAPTLEELLKLANGDLA